MLPADLDQVGAIEVASFSTPWSASMLEGELIYPYSHCFVACESNKIVSYVFSRLILDELHILNLAVHPGFRKQGLGEKLIDFLLHYAMQNKAGQAYLEVRTSNLAAIRLYQKTGFAIIRKRSRYYEDGSDAFEMALSLGDYSK